MKYNNYFSFLSELSIKISTNTHFFISGLSVINIYKKKPINFFEVFTNLSYEEMYSFFDNIYKLNSDYFDYICEIDSKYFFVKTLTNYSSQNYLLKDLNNFSTNTKDDIIYKEKQFLNNIDLNIRQILGYDCFYSIKTNCFYDLSENLKLIKERKFQNYSILSFIIKNEISQDYVKIPSISKLTKNNFLFIMLYSLGLNNKSFYFFMYEEAELFKKYIPELARLKYVYQSKIYHPEGDVFIHSILTTNSVPSDDLVLNIAALFHDTGKYTTWNKNGNNKGVNMFPDHSEAGVDIYSEFAYQNKKDCELFYLLEEKVNYLILNHMILYSKKIDKSLFNLIVEDDLFPSLMKLYKADVLGSLQDLSIYTKLKKKVNNLIKEYTASYL